MTVLYKKFDRAWTKIINCSDLDRRQWLGIMLVITPLNSDTGWKHVSEGNYGRK